MPAERFKILLKAKNLLTDLPLKVSFELHLPEIYSIIYRRNRQTVRKLLCGFYITDKPKLPQ